MMGMVRLLTFLLFSAAAAVSLRAQTGLPVVSQALPDIVLAPNGTARTIDLRGHFAADGVTGEVVQFSSPLGTFNVEMLASAAPVTVANFLAYVNDAAFNNTVIHRSSKLSGTSNQIIQGGGYRHSLPLGTVTQRAPIALEYNLANMRGTLAMARTSAPNSATSQWFFNVHDNTTILGPTNGGGYAVFGRVLGTGMTVVDAMAALPIYNLGSPITEIPLRGVQPGQTEVQLANFVNLTRVAVVPVYPGGAGATAVLGFTNGSTNSHPAIVNAQISGSNLVLTPQPNATGLSRVTIAATDTNGNRVTSSFVVGVDASGAAVVPPATPPALGGSVTLSVVASTAVSAYQWRKNGEPLAGATAATLALTNFASADAGLYSVTLTTANGNVTTDPVVVAPVISQKVAGQANEVGANITHPNGRQYDQLLLTGTAATFTADPGQVTRLSYVDLNNDIVQVEFSGSGAVTVVLDGASGPAAPTSYQQPQVAYMKGHASIFVAGAAADSFISAFTVGRMTAFDPTGAYNVTLPVSETNNPANNGNPIFKAGTAYDGVADVALLAISSPTSAFGAILSANAHYWHDRGVTGIYAPGVTFSSGGRIFLHDLGARGTASPVLRAGTATDVRITGGDLKQDNDAAIVVSGMTSVRMAAGTDSHGTALAARANQGRLVNLAGTDVTAATIVGP